MVRPSTVAPSTATRVNVGCFSLLDFWLMAVVSVMKVDLPPMFVTPVSVAISALWLAKSHFLPGAFRARANHTAGHETPRTEGTAGSPPRRRSPLKAVAKHASPAKARAR
jgi:hypothetical protein